MRIHPEGYPTLAVVATALTLLNILATRLLPQPARRGLLVLSGLLFGLVAQFFRDPTRHLPAHENSVIAPADGTIVAVEPVYEPEYFGDERLKISIYMSALNVHLNRIPVDGTVVYCRYHPGKYLVAFHPKASELNERNTVVIETPTGELLLVRQIAGIMARRITCYPAIGEVVQAGDELGFIKFGSSCDVFLPLNSAVRVRLQQKIKGGETILADWS
jgi:phosphatidylserine decarboxylase